MEYLYSCTVVWLLLTTIFSGKKFVDRLVFTLPTLVLAVTYGILAAKGFGVI